MLQGANVALGIRSSLGYVDAQVKGPPSCLWVIVVLGWTGCKSKWVIFSLL